MQSLAADVHPGVHPLEDAAFDAERAELEPAKTKDWRGPWRTGRLGAMKERPEYQGLPLPVRNLIDHMVKRHESPDEGITVGQAKLAAKFGVCRETINRWLKLAVEARVLTVEQRGRGIGVGNGKGGRSTNRYRLNDALLQGLPTTDVTQPSTQPSTQHPTAEATHVEAPFREHKEAPHDEAPAKDEERSLPADALTGSPESEVQGPNRGGPLRHTAIAEPKEGFDYITKTWSVPRW